MPANAIVRTAAEHAAAHFGAVVKWANPYPFRGGSVHKSASGQPVITIAPDLEPGEVLAVLVHELGHVLAPSWKYFTTTKPTEAPAVKIQPSLRRQWAEDDATMWAKRLDGWAAKHGGKTILGRLFALQDYPR